MSAVHAAVQAARDWLGQHVAEHLACDRMQLIDRCALHVSERFLVSLATARALAAEAWANAQTSSSGWHLSPGRSSPGAIVLRHVDGRMHAIAVDDIAPPPPAHFTGLHGPPPG